MATKKLMAPSTDAGQVKLFYLGAGTVVHIGGLPFRLVHVTTFDGHPGNFDLVLREAKDDFPAFNFEPDTIFRKIRRWWSA